MFETRIRESTITKYSLALQLLRIFALSKDPHVRERIIASIAPSVYGETNGLEHSLVDHTCHIQVLLR